MPCHIMSPTFTINFQGAIAETDKGVTCPWCGSAQGYVAFMAVMAVMAQVWKRIALADRLNSTNSASLQPCLAESPVMAQTARAIATPHTPMGPTATATATIPMDHLRVQATTTPTQAAAMDSTHPNRTPPVVSTHPTRTTATERRPPGVSRQEL